MATQSPTDPVWLITGTSSGIGQALALWVLEQKHRVVATVRSRGRSASAVATLEAAGASIVELEISDPDPIIAAAAQKAIQIYGRLDVLVNNAGYGVIGTVEETTDSQVRQQLETNFFGPLSLIRAALPTLRAQAASSSTAAAAGERRSSVIVNVSSVGGFDGLPGSAMYSASKFALEGASEGLAREVGSLGVNVLLVEPGAFRTAMHGKLSGGWVGDVYRAGPAGQIVSTLDALADRGAGGDPVKGARVIFAAVDKALRERRTEAVRVLLGSDSVERMEYKIGLLKKDLAEGAGAARSADF